MALQFNNYAKNNSILASFGSTFATNTIKIYPTTVPFPTGQEAVTAPAGFILNYSSVPFTIVGGQIVISGAPPNATSSAAGTASWVHITGVGNIPFLITNSLGLTGSLSVATLNSLTIANTTSYQLTSITIGIF